jgi:prepilin-type processing-associated H-X9-DG protein
VRGGKTERNPPLGGRLPDGDTVAAAPFQEWGWAYQILPYIEQDATYRDSIDDRVRETPVAIYFCPFRRQPSLNEKNAKGLRMAGIDYAGNGGITGSCKKVQTLINYNNPPYGDYTSTGLIIRSSAWYPGGRMRARWVTLDGGVPDGTSNTMLLAEKRMQRTKINKNPPNDDWSYVDGWSSDTIIRFHPEDEKLRPAQDSDDPVPEFALGSVHQGYFTAVFADGSVRRIRYTVKPEVLAVAMIRDDGVPIDPRDLER